MWGIFVPMHRAHESPHVFILIKAKSNLQETWSPAPTHWYKLNFDGSVNLNTWVSGLRVIIHDHFGHMKT